MPSETERQRRLFGAELQRKREGKETKTDLSESELQEFASKVKRGKRQNKVINQDIPFITGGRHNA